MKARLLALLIGLLLLAMIPALVMAQGQARPDRTFQFRMNAANPRPPQLAAPKPGAPAAAARPTVPVRTFIQPNAIYGLLNEGFENPWPSANWYVDEFSTYHDLCWGVTDYMRYKGHISAWPAAGCADGYDPSSYSYYADYMWTEMIYPMDLTGARAASVRFQYKSDLEFGYDVFYWCASPDYGVNWYCQGQTGSTRRWRQVNVNLADVPGYGNMLDSSGFAFMWGFSSDYSVTDLGTYVDAIKIKAVGP